MTDHRTSSIFSIALLLAVTFTTCFAQYQQQQRNQQYSNGASGGGNVYGASVGQRYQVQGSYNSQTNGRGQQYGQNQQQQQPNYQQQQYQQNYQQGQQYNQYNNGYGQQQNQNSAPLRSAIVNTPQQFSSNQIQGARVDIRLMSYTNQDFSLSNTTTCKCPTSSCVFLPSDAQNNCNFGYMTVISAEGQSIQLVQSDFTPFYGASTNGNWTQPHSFVMSSKPVAIDIIVQHLGVVIDKTSGNLQLFNHLQLVDSFIVNMNEIDPTANGGGSTTLTLYGQQLNTVMTLSLSVQCQAGMLGDNCDMSCPANGVNTTGSNSNSVICFNNNTNVYSSCAWNAYKTQVTNCATCSYGYASTNMTCHSTNVVTEYVGVSSAFRTWTIVLGCLLGIAVLFIVALIVAYIIIKSKEHERETAMYTQSQNHTYPAKDPSTRPLIDDEWNPRRPAALDTERDSFGRSQRARQEHEV